MVITEDPPEVNEDPEIGLLRGQLEQAQKESKNLDDSYSKLTQESLRLSKSYKQDLAILQAKLDCARGIVVEWERLGKKRIVLIDELEASILTLKTALGMVDSSAQPSTTPDWRKEPMHMEQLGYKENPYLASLKEKSPDTTTNPSASDQAKAIIDGAFGDKRTWLKYPNLHDGIEAAISHAFRAGKAIAEKPSDTPVRVRESWNKETGEHEIRILACPHCVCSCIDCSGCGQAEKDCKR